MSCFATCMRLFPATTGTTLPGMPSRGLGPEVSVPGLVKKWRRRKEAGPLDVARLRESFAHIAVHGDELPLFFYSDLFIKHPEVRYMFPVSMTAQRGRFFEALVKIVSQVDRIDELTMYLQGLGRDHRKFGVMAENYTAVGDSLLTT